jgi:hypothetical protein
MKKLRLAEFVAAGLILSGLNLIAPGAAFGQVRQATRPSYTPPVTTRVQSQTATQPRSNSGSQQQTGSAGQSQSRQTTSGQSAARHQSQSSTQRQTPQHQSQSAARRTSSSAAQPRTQPRQQARQNKEQQKQQQKQQAHQKKDQQKKQLNQTKEQARQQKERQKQQQKQQKEQARQQKELQKQQKSKKSEGSAGKKSAAPSSSPAVPKGPVSAAASAKSSTGVLTPSESQARIQQLNSTRSNMSGINRRPLPAGDVTVHSNGGMTVRTEGGRQYGVRSNATLASYRDREKTVSFNQRGKISSLHTANMDVYHGAHGQRTIVSRRADGSKVVSTGPHSGYVERSAVVNNRSYVQRTTVVNQHVYTSTFVATSHGGLVVAAFVPPVFFAPGFYGWAFYPWAAPISFSWGWFGAPWYLGPNPYFAASPLYPNASLWLTDYMIGDTLATAYQLHNDALLSDEDGGAEDSADADMTADDDSESGRSETIHADVTTPITPEIKAEIAEEVKQELANDNAGAANTRQISFDVLPAALRSPKHVFVVSNDLDVTTANQQVCALQAGDMLQLLVPAESDAGLVQLRVASSKRMDCPAGILVSVSRSDLQEMQNSFQARVESGLEKLQNDHGLAGLPAAPAEAVAALPRPAVEGLTPASAGATSVAIDQLREQADQMESQAVNSAL